MCFADIFPSGSCFGEHHPRDVKLSFSDYVSAGCSTKTLNIAKRPSRCSIWGIWMKHSIAILLYSVFACVPIFTSQLTLAGRLETFAIAKSMLVIVWLLWIWIILVSWLFGHSYIPLTFLMFWSLVMYFFKRLNRDQDTFIKLLTILKQTVNHRIVYLTWNKSESESMRVVLLFLSWHSLD